MSEEHKTITTKQAVAATLLGFEAMQKIAKEISREIDFAKQWLGEMEAMGEDHDRLNEAMIGLGSAERKVEDLGLVLESEQRYLHRVKNRSTLMTMKKDGIERMLEKVAQDVRELLV